VSLTRYHQYSKSFFVHTELFIFTKNIFFSSLRFLKNTFSVETDGVTLKHDDDDEESSFRVFALAKFIHPLIFTFHSSNAHTDQTLYVLPRENGKLRAHYVQTGKEKSQSG
jgi:hypothetical protein